MSPYLAPLSGLLIRTTTDDDDNESLRDSSREKTD